ncbi:MAG TPA: hypothetical protein VLG47_04515 [Candidatus Saccharimonadales bacterium]|nr:hypothetical protein [Candidatus Saccharimonadales bacterium]
MSKVLFHRNSPPGGLVNARRPIVLRPPDGPPASIAVDFQKRELVLVPTLVGVAFGLNGTIRIETHRRDGDCGALTLASGTSNVDPGLGRLMGTAKYLDATDADIEEAIRLAHWGVTGFDDDSPVVPRRGTTEHAALSQFDDDKHYFDNDVMNAAMQMLLERAGVSTVTGSCTV